MIDSTLTAEPPPAPVLYSAPDPAIFTDPADEARAAESADLAQQKAVAATPFEWKGRLLAPFAISREADWRLHRLLIGAPPLSIALHDVNSSWADALRVVWFCLHEPETWLHMPPVPVSDDSDDRDLATRRALAVEIAIRKWADAEIRNGEMNEVLNLFFAIFNRAHSTHAAVVSEGGGGKKKDAPCPPESAATSP